MADVLTNMLDHSDINTLNKSRDALAVVALSAAASDGNVSKEEWFRLVALGLASPLFPNDIDDIIARASSLIFFVIKNGPGNAMFNAGLQLSQNLKETAFTWAVEIVAADGVIDEKEKQFLERVVTEFNIGKATAQKIVEIIIIKNRLT